MNFFCIADKDSALGFQFSGVQTRQASNVAEAKEALAVALATEDIGVIIVTEKVSRLIGDQIDELTYKQDLPLVLEIPSRGGKRRTRDIGEFLKRSIGISV
jgi:V/A-type H+-transporting ATPase subunit F